MIASTKDQILHVLQAHDGLTVAGLVDAMEVGSASIRRHLDHLRVEGLVDVRVERHGVGRPAFVFYTTAEAEERTPAAYSRLLSRLYAGLRSLDEQKIHGQDGEQVLRTAFEAAAEQVAHDYEGDVGADSLEGRVAQTSQALKGEGIVDDWAKREEGYRLINTACPYRQATVNTRAPCELDRRAIELLVDAPVRQISRIADGQPACEYIVTATKEEQDT